MVDTSDVFHNSLPVAPERPATVFLSYRREDVEEVQSLQQRLKIYGVRAWRDLTDMLAGGVSENEVTAAIEEADAFVLYVTWACLESDFIWDIEVRSALQRWNRDPSFKIIPVLCGPTLDDLQRVSMARGLRSLQHFNAISLPASGTDVNGEEFNKEIRKVATSVLKAALNQRLRRIGADYSYEPVICLRTFKDRPGARCLDLDLNWIEFFPPSKALLPPDTAWRDVLFPALNDVKDMLGEMVSSRHLHVYVQTILPVAFAFGYVFPEASHITLLLEGPHGTWSTAGTPSTTEPLRCLSSTATGDKRTALVELAISRDTAYEMVQCVSDLHLLFSHHLRFEPLNGPSQNAVENSEQALAMARQIGRELRRLCDTKGVKHVHLFAALPAALAVMVGHQLNAVCAVTLYHHVQGQGYIQACTLGAPRSSL